MSSINWDLSRLDTGDRSALKRAAGTLELDIPARRAFYKVDHLPDKNWEDQRYAALCMACMWREWETPDVQPIEVCLRTLYRGNGEEPSQGIADRIDAALELRWDQSGYLLGKLVNLVRLIHSATNMKPDFEAFAEDLRYWNSDTRSVQKKWLRAIYGTYTTDSNDETNKNEEEH